ncbi:larval cuticle protein 65Ab1-like [Musca autumnalis]|uniref:larval cuticle protein 65Ab1-like n=1 Tax=Musca autumnalis TaxID=221902 RepID=UPI003CEE91D8
MKFIIVFVALFAFAMATGHDEVQIVKQVSDVGPENFEYVAETSDGTYEAAAGHLENAGTDHESIVVKGTYSWIDEKTGEKYTVEYIADENGFQPKGAHLPVA